MKTLQLIKVDFHTLFKDIDNDVKILDEYRISNTFPINIFAPDDLDDIKLSATLYSWSKNFPWSKKCHYYSNVTENSVHFFIKIKDDEGLMGHLPSR